MQIGSLLKEYRLSQGKRQKEFVGEVVSQSYYSKVEKMLIELQQKI
ncbi:XRE family transcriptional regulator [Lactobacillus mulieris]|nr:XRE family transcriptional regulator [Lactobacillus mulieris]MCF1784018.1 XRE family transcriptional regulator [Lactobacillus mulieris]MCW8104873.1 XRE family transcriptional regulator [Lactobacillus mulieris]MDK6803821.1 XRE family transcriptional regulator [Lactobacillus mulieris]MDK8382995.1 XRE family transcriptional regulator [Lactobacillus mulieris]MDT9621120.1 XRE family transcriptional regulator [Lactobacillus mulieris]